MTAKKPVYNPSKVEFPHKWSCRPHQLPIWHHMMSDNATNKRAVAVWHRRAGKDSFGINFMATRAVMDPGLYYYMAPSQKHARKIIWDNIGADGLRIIDQAFPSYVRESTSDQEMRIVLKELHNKKRSIFQLVGSDNYNSIVGTNPKGIVFSEWSIADKPEAWEYLQPILTENKGWALFIYTPRGLNHGYKLARMAEVNEDWFFERLTIDHTKNADGTPLVTPQQIQDLRDSGTSEISIQQEFYCAFHQDTERQLFNTNLVKEAMGRKPTHYDPGAAVIMGVDCARFGDDRSVIAIRTGRDFQSIPLIVLKGKTSTIELATAIQSAALKYKPDAIFIDSTGVGGGVYDTCKSMRIPYIFPINFQNSAQDKDKYANIRAEMFQRFADWFEDPEVCFFNDNALLEQASCLQFSEDFDPHGRPKLEKKSKIKKDTGISPDEMDACALTFAKTVLRRDVARHRRNGPRRKAIMN